MLRRIGDRCGPAIPDSGDFVHYDFTPANLLSDGTAITGVIDINPPILTGDRAFDLATLLFYHYDHAECGAPAVAGAACGERAGPSNRFAVPAGTRWVVSRPLHWASGYENHRSEVIHRG